MLNWLRQKIMARRRSIFTFWDGRKIVSDDPMRIFRALLAHPKFDWNTHPHFIDTYGRDPKSHEDRETVLDAVCEVFGVQRFHPETQAGLTEEELLSLLWAFTSYCDKKKASTNPSPTPAESMGRDTSGEPCPTPNSLDSGSMSAELNFETPPV